MKQLLLLTLLSLFTLTLGAQDSKDKYLTDAAGSVCKCMEDQADDPAASPEMALGLCMITYVQQDQERYEEWFGPLDYSDESAMESLGEELGIKMLTVCPNTLMSVIGAMEENGTLDLDDDEDEVVVEQSFTGSFTKMTGEDLVTLSFKQDNGRPVKLLWMGYFPGSEMVEGGKLKGDVLVSYKMVEVYSAASGEYQMRRVITGLEKL